jgi:hypothetical protein
VNPVPKLEEEEVLPMVAIFFTQSRPNNHVQFLFVIVPSFKKFLF